MNHTALRALTASLVVASATVALGGCMVASPQPAVYGQYGYATVAAPNTVYYQGGNYGGDGRGGGKSSAMACHEVPRTGHGRQPGFVCLNVQCTK